jgi:hypothetical protein
MDTARLDRAAQAKLTRMRLDGEDRLYQLTLGNRGRVYGIREGHHFELLWWDPNHTVCVVEKKG